MCQLPILQLRKPRHKESEDLPRVPTANSDTGSSPKARSPEPRSALTVLLLCLHLAFPLCAFLSCFPILPFPTDFPPLLFCLLKRPTGSHLWVTLTPRAHLAMSADHCLRYGCHTGGGGGVSTVRPGTRSGQGQPIATKSCPPRIPTVSKPRNPTALGDKKFAHVKVLGTVPAR